MKKRLCLFLCVLSCLMLVAGCSLTKVNENLDRDLLEETTEAFAQTWFAYDFQAVIDTYADQMSEEDLADYEEFVRLQEEHGDMVEVVKSQYTTAADTATVVETISTQKGDEDLDVTVTYDADGNISSWKVAEHETKGEIMQRAGLNTLMGILIVFIMLILICLLIYCFKFVNIWQERWQKRKEKSAPAPAPEPASKQPEPEIAVQDETDDEELIAVIAAAIAAAEQTECTDGLIVRSIVRRN